jgi:hypothetical protein
VIGVDIKKASRCYMPDRDWDTMRQARPPGSEDWSAKKQDRVGLWHFWRTLRNLRSVRSMPDDLYDRDILTWSRHQAALLRRLARGERVNGVDWAHVVEEIDDVGLSELNTVRSYLRQMLVHLLKVQGWPNNQAVDHWRSEIGSFQADAAQRLVPSMRRRINLTTLYDKARSQLDRVKYDGVPAAAWPDVCPMTLDELLNAARGTLEQRLRDATSDDRTVAE